jgi:quinoprotein glucose dehydrogenase
MTRVVFGVAALLFWLGSAGVGFGATGAAQEGEPQTWYTFTGDLAAQKFATDTQITPANVSQLRIAWQLHTGDVSDGSGTLPATAWSATPLFVNDTLYMSTPFYRIFAGGPERSGRIWWRHLAP